MAVVVGNMHKSHISTSSTDMSRQSSCTVRNVMRNDDDAINNTSNDGFQLMTSWVPAGVVLPLPELLIVSISGA